MIIVYQYPLIGPKKIMNKDYIIKKKFLSRSVADLSALYSFYNYLSNPNVEGTTAQVPLSHYVYTDPLMESLATLSHPKMEKITRLELLPTYTYFRLYTPGAILKPHIDRDACEISVSVCLGWDYKGVTDDYRWPFYVGESRIDLDIGDAVVYKGIDVEHWRDEFIAEEDSWHAQAFLHYVDKNGPNAEHIWDQIKTPVNWRGNEIFGYRHHARRTDYNIDIDKYYYANLHI